MFFINEIKIKDKLSLLKDTDNHIYDCILQKIEFDKRVRFKKILRQTVRRYLARGIEEYHRRITVKDIINKINRQSSKKIILYVSALPAFNLVRQSIYLRQTGEFETIILMEQPWLGEFAEKCFDTVYVYDSCYNLCQILSEARPYLVHVLGCSYYSEYHAILAKYLSRSAVVFEFFDIPSLSIASEDLIEVHGKTEADLIYAAEQFACERTDGLILGYSPEALGLLNNKYNISAPTLEFHSYVCEQFISSGNGKYSDADNRIHIAYGGNVAPSKASEKLFGDVQFHNMASKVSSQGIYFDIYYSPHVSPIKAKKEYWDYMLLAKNNKFFNFMKGLHPDEVTDEFDKYDFGAMIYLYNRGTFLEEHNGTRLPGKVFTYLEAGIPILVSEECRYVAKLVKEHEIGIVVKQADIDNLSDIVSSYDRKKLKANVEKAKEELSMKKHINRLIAFYREVYTRASAKQVSQ